MMRFRRKFYVDSEIQFPLILSLILSVTIQGAFVGWGFSKALAIAGEWSRANQVADFFLALFATIIPVVLLNFALGAYLSHRIAGPLTHLRKAMEDAAGGNLDAEVYTRQGDLLRSYGQAFNAMLGSIRAVLRRERSRAAEAAGLLARCRERLAGAEGLAPQARRELETLIDDALARLG